MRQFLRRTALTTLKTAGAFGFVKNSAWRRLRLLILCYHGIALEDEHLWKPSLFMSPAQLEERLEILRKGEYAVLSLGEALERLYRRDLPARSVVITFDDGTHDFYQRAYPLIKKYRFPVTVYLTTYYSDFQRPVFRLICSYMMWKRRDLGRMKLDEFNIEGSLDLGSALAREDAANQLVQWADAQDLSGEQRDQIAARLARRLGLDYDELRAKRILQVMSQAEVKQLAMEGVDFQLHTHRHRTPLNEELFWREIADNRSRIASATGKTTQHFCYPSGAYRPEFLPWLSAEGLVSATTCDTGFATPESNPLLLPRCIDTGGRTSLEFEGWTCGVSQFLSRSKRAALAYAPDL